MSSIPVLLAERASGKLVHAELRDVVDKEQIQDCFWRWQPEMQQLLDYSRFVKAVALGTLQSLG